MTTLFSTRPGVVTVIPEDSPSGLIMAIGGRGTSLAVPGQGSYFNMRSIVTQITVEQQDDLQIQKSLSARRYAFIFGRGVGNAQISGIAFTENCNNGGTTGLESICNYFEATRVSSSGQVYDMVLGAAAASRFKIMVHGMNISLARPEQRLAEFSIACKVFK